MNTGGNFHTPVLLKEAIRFLNVKENGIYVDCTLGGGGHSEEILKNGGKIIGIDRDLEAIEFTRKRLSQACPLGAFRWTLVKGNFADLTEILQSLNVDKVDGILLDLGISSHQLEMAERGFSFSSEFELDMRMDPDLKVKASDLINGLNEGELYELFNKLGEEDYSRAIARAVCRARRLAPLVNCRQLADLVTRSVPPRAKFGRIHPATKIFQALRIAVNDELNNLKEVLLQAGEVLKPGGRLVIISFHSLEEKIVKEYLKEKEENGTYKLLTKRPIEPNDNEVKNNPRARSGKLRAAEKNK